MHTTGKITANQVAAAVAKQNEVIQQLKRISSSGAAGGFSAPQVKMANAIHLVEAALPKIDSTLKPKLNPTIIIPSSLSGETVDIRDASGAIDNTKIGNLATELAKLRTNIEKERTAPATPNGRGGKILGGANEVA